MMSTVSRQFTKIALASLVAVVCASANAIAVGDTVPIVNPGFETYSGGAGFWKFPGWSLGNPTGELGIDGTGEGRGSPAGGYFLTMGYVEGWGSPMRHNAESIYQSISGLTVGATYTVSFYSGAYHTPDAMTERWQVSFGNQTQNGKVVNSDGSFNNMGWVQDKLSFVATETTQRLTFQSVFLDARPGASPEILTLDGLALTVTAVPEPSTAALGLAGLALLGFLVSGRKRAKS